MKIKVSDLRHHPLNQDIYTLSDIDDLMSSIQEVGLLQPLSIDQHNQVVSGNRRFKAISELGWSEVECERVQVSPDNAPQSRFICQTV